MVIVPAWPAPAGLIAALLTVRLPLMSVAGDVTRPAVRVPTLIVYPLGRTDVSRTPPGAIEMLPPPSVPPESTARVPLLMVVPPL